MSHTTFAWPFPHGHIRSEEGVRSYWYFVMSFTHGWIRGEYGKTTIGLFISSLPMEISDVGWENRATDLPSYSDTLGTRGKVSL